MAEKIKIFISYSHDDSLIKKKLESHLSVLLRTNNAEIWADNIIIPGQQWQKEISENLNSANMILLLLSANFIRSDYCYLNEMIEAVNKHKNGETCVIPILIEEFYWQDPRFNLPFRDIEMQPKDPENGRLKALSLWTGGDDGFAETIKGITHAMFDLQKNLKVVKNRNVEERRKKIESMVSESKLDDASSELMDFISQYSNQAETVNEPAIKELRTNSIMIKGKCTAFRNNLEKELANNPGILDTLGKLMYDILDLLEKVYAFIKRLFGYDPTAQQI